MTLFRRSDEKGDVRQGFIEQAQYDVLCKQAGVSVGGVLCWLWGTHAESPRENCRVSVALKSIWLIVSFDFIKPSPANPVMQY